MCFAEYLNDFITFRRIFPTLSTISRIQVIYDILYDLIIMKVLHYLGILTMFFLLSLGMHAQETIASAGGSDSSGEGSVDYSVGQVFHETYSSANGKLSFGVQLPYEIMAGVGFEDLSWIGLTATVYPNPVKDQLILSIDRFDIFDLSYQIYDMNGKLIKFEEFDNTRINIDLSALSPSSYILRVVSSKKELKTFIIIKN